MENKKHYNVGYTIGEYSDYREINVFVTDNEEMADKWVEKFNALLEKVRSFHNHLNKLICDDMSDDDVPYFYGLRTKYGDSNDINRPFKREIQFRK